MTKTVDILDQARTALLHGTPEQRFNMAAILTDHLAQLRSDEPESPLSDGVWKSGSADGEPWVEVALGPMVMTEDENFVHIRPAFDPASIPDCPRCGAQHWPQCPSEKSSVAPVNSEHIHKVMYGDPYEASSCALDAALSCPDCGTGRGALIGWEHDCTTLKVSASKDDSPA